MSLHLAPGLDLPVKFATEGVAVIGMRGSGKSNTEVRWAEVLYENGIPFVAVDPKGDWGGIRSSANGKKPGLAVPVFGGLTGDFPLEEHLGRRIADLLVDKNLSAVLDVSRLSIAGRARFLTDFFNQLIDRHQQEPHVRCVILEEAHRYIPQNVSRETARVKEAAAAVLLEGRAFGLGCWAATQRPARLHKDVLEEVGTAVIHRIGAAASNDLKTIAGWVKHEDLDGEIVPSLTKLQDGEAWILAPSTLGIAKRVRFDRRKTFDSAATPLVGAGSRPILTMADIDSAAIKEALVDAIEDAKKNDPAELKKKLVAAEKRILELEAWTPPPPPPAVNGLPKDLSSKLGAIRSTVVGCAHDLAKNLQVLSDLVDEAIDFHEPNVVVPFAKKDVAAARDKIRRAPEEIVVKNSTGDTVELPSGERLLLGFVVQQHDGASFSLLRIQSGYKTSSVKTYLQRLRTKGLVDNIGGRFMATDVGRAVVGDPEPLPTGDALRAHYLAEIPEGEGRVLSELFAVYPSGLDQDQIGAVTPYAPSSVKTYVQRLRSRELVVVEDGRVRASALLFD